MKNIYLFVLVWVFYDVQAQIYEDHYGLGQSVGITVTSSHQSGGDRAGYTLTGDDLQVDSIEASRFLAQASLGASYDEIMQLTNIGIDAWLDNQINLPPRSFAAKYDSIHQEAIAMITIDADLNRYLSFSFYEMVMTYNNVLRQKVAFALSQIFVVSPYFNPVISDEGRAVASYYDILYLNAFGNYRDILEKVSTHPVMGIYLSHFQNEKADLIQGILPDENYAREVLQLFSIGLLELNNDGSFKLDENGNAIATYSINDIEELAKVFTGFSGSPSAQEIGSTFDENLRNYDLTQPMVLFQEYHDNREKKLLGDTYIPPDQDGLQDMNDAVDIIFNHPNVGPFIALRLIQQLIKSNPSPAYINRVATAFNNNGSGVRGDMEAVVKAILIDPEARDMAWIDDPQSGKLIQPIERFTKLFKAFNTSTPSGRYWLEDEKEFSPGIAQGFLSSPTVFNFFTPFFAEKNFVAPEGLVSPEFQIINSNTGISYLNLVENSLERSPFSNRTAVSDSMITLIANDLDMPSFDYSVEEHIYNSQGLIPLLDHLDFLLTRGQLSVNTKTIICNTINDKLARISDYNFSLIIIDAIYFIMISPDFVILK